MRLALKIPTPNGMLLQDHVDSVRVPATDGVYEILPNHAPIFIALHAGELAVSQAGEIEHWFIEGGTCHMENNECTIMVKNVIDLETVDIASIKSALKAIVDPNFSNVARQLLEAQLAYKQTYKNT